MAITPRVAPAFPIGERLPPAPDIAPYSGSVDQRLATLANAVSRKAETGSVAVFAAIILMDPNGVMWRVNVDTAGNLDVTQVPRS